MKRKFHGDFDIQKDNAVEAFVAGKKYSGIVDSITKDGEFGRKIVVKTNDGKKVTADLGNTRRVTKGAAQKKREYAKRHGLF